MKRKGDNIILTVRYAVDDAAGFEAAVKNCSNDRFTIMDGETIAFESSEHGTYELHLTRLKEQEKQCLKALNINFCINMPFIKFNDLVDTTFELVQ